MFVSSWDDDYYFLRESDTALRFNIFCFLIKFFFYGTLKWIDNDIINLKATKCEPGISGRLFIFNRFNWWSTIFVVPLLLKRIKYDNIAETGIHLSSASLNTTSGDLPVTLSLTSLLIKKERIITFFFLLVLIGFCVDQKIVGEEDVMSPYNVMGRDFFFPTSSIRSCRYIYFFCVCVDKGLPQCCAHINDTIVNFFSSFHRIEFSITKIRNLDPKKRYV